jgi:predicted Ser/Thr protein kinase
LSLPTPGERPVRDAPVSFTESDLADGNTRLLRKGAWGKADILLVETRRGRAIVKDFRRKPLPVRWYGRWQIRRESSIYRRLAGLRGVPAWYGRIGRHAMALEYVEGERISRWKRREVPPDLFPRLRSLIESIHDRGIVHIDLRKRDNILVGNDGEVYILDFNAAFRFEPGSAGFRWIFPALRRIDHFGFLKWKAALAPAQLSEAERSALARMTFLRRFWFFK